MRILIVCNHWPVASGRYAADAFKRLGHDVRTTGPAHGRDIWGMQVDEKYVWTPQPPEAGWQQDLVVVMDSDRDILDNVNLFAGKLAAPWVVWGVDNHVRDYRRDYFAHYFLAHRNVTQQTFDEKTTWLPCAYDPVWFTPSKIPWEQREWDIALVGVPYDRRVRLVEKLRAAGLKVFAGAGLLYEEYRQVYHNSRASLCVSANGDVAQRIFETGAMGCLVLTDPLADLVDIKTGHTPATNKALNLAGFAVYSSDDECVSQAEQLIRQTPEMGKNGARLMQKRCRPHTWDARAKQIIAWMQGGAVTQPEGKASTATLGVKPMVVNDENGRPQVVMVVTEDEKDSTQRHEGAKAQSREEDKSVTQRLGDTETQGEAAPEAAKVEIIEPKPYLNLGCGKTHFPSARPPGHEMVDAGIYAYPAWLNVDKVEGVGADVTFDLFTYPWPLDDNSFDGAVLGHIVEHIPHEIKVHEERVPPPGVVQRGGQFFDERTGQRVKVEFDTTRQETLRKMQDGWYAFFSELWRVLTPGARAHIVSPWGWSDGAITDPSHTRYLTVNTFTHGLAPENNGGATFRYEVDCNFKLAAPAAYRITEMFRHLMAVPEDDADEAERKQRELTLALMTRINVAYDFYVQLEAVK